VEPVRFIAYVFHIQLMYKCERFESELSRSGLILPDVCLLCTEHTRVSSIVLCLVSHSVCVFFGGGEMHQGATSTVSATVDQKADTNWQELPQAFE